MSSELTYTLLIRLAVAGMLGTLIGLEREYRAKEAGMRTHFLVTLGSCLIMIVSQYGFGDNFSDASRVAAQIVSGIGFIGAGTIMMNNQFVRGLTTAAGLWVAAGIGMAVGGGLYIIAVTTTIMALLGLELLQRVFQRFQARHIELEFTTSRNSDLVEITSLLGDLHCKVAKCSVAGCGVECGGRIRVKMLLYEHSHVDETQLLDLLGKFPDVQIEKIS